MRLTIVVFCFCLSAGCDKSDLQTERLLSIRTGIFYGFCQGLCDYEFILKEETITYTQKANVGSMEERKCELPLEATEWEKLENLVDDRFFDLDSVYGCPDCADQGSEYIFVTTSMRTYGIHIEPNIEIAIHPMVEELRNIRFEVAESPGCQ